MNRFPVQERRQHHASTGTADMYVHVFDELELAVEVVLFPSNELTTERRCTDHSASV